VSAKLVLLPHSLNCISPLYLHRFSPVNSLQRCKFVFTSLPADDCLTTKLSLRRSVGQSNKTPTWGLRPDFYYCQTVGGLLMWGAVSDERTGLSFTIAAVLASAVIGSKSRGTRDHTLLSEVRDFPFRQVNSRLVLLKIYRHGPYGKHRFQQFFSVTQLSHGPRREHRFEVSLLVRVRNPLPSDGRCLLSHY
jgi:hypothetical protein